MKKEKIIIVVAIVLVSTLFCLFKYDVIKTNKNKNTEMEQEEKVPLSGQRITITFDANGGSLSKKKVTINKGSKIGTLPTSTRKNYQFVGWYTKKTGGTKVTSNTKFSNSGTIYAIWKAIDVNGITLNKSSASIKVGEQLTLKANITPSNATPPTLTWTSSNTKVATVSNTGVVKAINAGTAVITVSSKNGKKATCKITVTNKSSSTTVDDNIVWGYKDNKTVNPTLANETFFKDLVKKGIGSISNGVYSYSDFTYDYKNNRLSCKRGSKVCYEGSAPVRIYYPQKVDLSNVNTFTFFGGTGEIHFGGFFEEVRKNSSLIKSGGIVILVGSYGSNYQYQYAINATKFIKDITKQKSGKKNSIGGYSGGGPAASEAMMNGKYDRLFIVHSNFPTTFSDSTTKAAQSLKNKTIYVYSPSGDHMQNKTQDTLNALKAAGAGKNITIVSNNNEIINNFKNKFTIVNPGKAQGSGHGYVNFTNGNLFAFACKD